MSKEDEILKAQEAEENTHLVIEKLMDDLRTYRDKTPEEEEAAHLYWKQKNIEDERVWVNVVMGSIDTRIRLFMEDISNHLAAKLSYDYLGLQEKIDNRVPPQVYKYKSQQYPVKVEITIEDLPYSLGDLDDDDQLEALEEAREKSGVRSKILDSVHATVKGLHAAATDIMNEDTMK